jgi:undecaprenyl-diphosphatase
MNVDVALFRLINIDMGWDALAPLMKVMSTLVYFAPVILALVAWMVFRDGRRGRVTVAALLLLIPVSDQLSSHVIKPWVGRPRPCRAEAGIEGVKTHGARCSSRGSFPSSHAVNIAAVAFLLAGRYRRAVVPAAAVAFLVGYSRIYLGVHYPLDVIGGWALGCLLGVGAVWLAGWGDRLLARRFPESGDAKLT